MTPFKRALLVAAAILPATAAVAADIVVHRDPGCGCCSQWAGIVRKAFQSNVRIVDDKNRAAIQKRAGLPPALASCHTAVIDGLVFEGHVPTADMQRLLKERPAGVRGLVVPGMPTGSPGMEAPGRKPQAFDVIAFGAGGQRVYAHHGG